MKKSANAIVIFEHKFLLLLRDNKQTISDPNKWSILGGEVEEGESYEEALKRELFEEANLSPKNIVYLGILTTPNSANHAVYWVELTEDEIKQLELGDEGQELRLFSFEEIKNLDLSSNLKWYFNTYEEYLKNIIEKGDAIIPEKLGLKI